MRKSPSPDPVKELVTVDSWNWRGAASTFSYVCAAGFEDRALRGVEILAKEKIPISQAVIVEFRESVLDENLRNCDSIKATLKKRVGLEASRISVVQIDGIESLWDLMLSFKGSRKQKVILDITAMPHGIILRALRSAYRNRIIPVVWYTEAETYYPSLKDASKYLDNADDELAFDIASRQEVEAVMYAGLASVGTVKGYEGRIIPTSPTSVVIFPTFKRLRTSAILSELEVNRRVFMMSLPVREDLKWRERALRVINFDLIDPDTDIVRTLSTLSPMDCYRELTRLLSDGIVSPRGNIIICPHGSKMQTVGIWMFCEENPEVRVVIAHPREYFPSKYSVGFRSTFAFDPATVQPHLAEMGK